MHQASLRVLAPLRAPSTRSWAARALWSSSGGARFSTAASAFHTRPCKGIASSRELLSKPSAVAYSSDSRPPVQYKIDRKHEKEVGKQKLDVRPDEVTIDSSVRHIIEPSQHPEEPPAVSETLASDVHAVKDAFALTAVPRKAYALGLSGTIPYFITSISTVYLGGVLRKGSSSALISQETAQQWLQMLEPIQLGYGAVIISFLGAVHWGMEIMEKTPEHGRTRFRYAMAILAPAAAWPTLFFPVHFALTGQFLAFTMLYFADSRATKLGWTPQWYSAYRFVLTAVVGSAILVSLLFRAKIDDAGGDISQRMESGMHQRGPTEDNYSAKWARLEKKEKAKIKAEKEKAEKEKAEKEKDSKDEEKGGKEKKETPDEQKTDDSKSGDAEGKVKTQKKGSGDEVRTDGDVSSKSAKGDEEANGKDGEKDE